MTFKAGIAAKNVSGKPLVVHVHSTEFDRSGKSVNPAICAIEKAGMDEACKVLAVSNLTKHKLIDNYHLTPAKIATVYNAVKPLALETVRKEKLPDVKFVITFLGRITMQKGPEYFIDAANLVLQQTRNVQFIMAGKGDLRNTMMTRTSDLGISAYFDFPGFIHDDDIGTLFSKSDAFVMPSVSEPFGIVALEAMQAKVPVIVSKQSGVAEVVENVIKVDYWDISEMARAIVVMINDPVFCSNISSKAKIEVDELSWMKVAKEVHNLYLELDSNQKLEPKYPR